MVENDNKIYLLLQKKEVTKAPEEENKTVIDKPPEVEQPKTEPKNVPFEEVGIIGGTLMGAIYLALRKRR